MLWLFVVAVDDEVLLSLAHQNYKNGNYKQALEHSKAVYERNPRRTDNLLLLGATYYQVGYFVMWIIVFSILFFSFLLVCFTCGKGFG